MEIACIISLEHETLPKAELKAVLAAENIPFNIKKEYKGFLILEVPEECSKTLPSALRRLSLAHEIFQMDINTNTQKLMEEINNYPWYKVVDGEFAVRVKKIGKNPHINTLEMEKDVGGIIKNRMGRKAKVNLQNPKFFIRMVLLDHEVYMGRRLIKIPKKHFFQLKPHKRPFFYPGSMSPKLARCMVNLTQINKGETLLDPFCGTGGILIEAGMIGAHVVGTDLDPKMVVGSIKNLSHCGIGDYYIFRSDVRQLNLHYKVDAVATDPPYGISASTGGEKSQKLCEEALLSLEKSIKDGGRICLATPHYFDMDMVLEGRKLEIIEQHHIRMHKSLTRVISVFKKI